jgi:hypothetical protein
MDGDILTARLLTANERSELSQWIVRKISNRISRAYNANCDGHHFRERMHGYIGKHLQRLLFPIARRLDKEAMVDQMIEESWWG